jgi:hypothetical protein
MCLVLVELAPGFSDGANVKLHVPEQKQRKMKKRPGYEQEQTPDQKKRIVNQQDLPSTWARTAARRRTKNFSQKNTGLEITSSEIHTLRSLLACDNQRQLLDEIKSFS